MVSPRRKRRSDDGEARQKHDRSAVHEIHSLRVLIPLPAQRDDTLRRVTALGSEAHVKSFIRVAVVIAVVAASPALVAQWDPRTGAAVPRDAKGDPDLNGPVPRTADGKPDLSGVWQGIGGGQPAAAAPPSGPPVAGFRDVAQNIKEGLPVKPEGAALLKERRDGNSKDNPEAHCLPMGIMQFHTQGAPRKLVQTPGLLVI